MSIQNRLKKSEQLTAQNVAGKNEHKRAPMFPNDDFIVAYNHHHEAVSRYGDDAWDFTAYRQSEAHAHSKMRFEKLPDSQRHQVKQAMYAVLFLDDWQASAQISLSTSLRYLMAVRRVAWYAHENKTTLFDVFNNEKHLIAATSRMTSLTLLRGLGSVIDHLHLLGPDRCGIPVLKSDEFQHIKLTKFGYYSTNQHPVIPARILSNLIAQLDGFENEIKPHIEAICTLIHRMSEDKCYRRSPSKQRMHGRRKHNLSAEFSDDLNTYGLHNLFKKFDITGPKQLKLFLTRIQHYGKLKIHIFSGMRSSEVLSLKVGCLLKVKSTIISCYELSGNTTKLSGGKKNVKWITSADVVGTVAILETIAMCINKYARMPEAEISLFISPSHSGLTGLPIKAVASAKISQFQQRGTEVFPYLDENLFRLCEEDIQALDKIDPFRAWEAEERFKKGSTWRFTTHQFRRSLAFYVSQSGLVSLQVLKRQLKHITRNMTLYYARAMEVSGGYDVEDHFFHFLNRRESEADAAAFWASIIHSSEKLLGPNGRILEKGMVADYRHITFETPKNELVREFRQGRISYTETAMGACTSTEPCDKKAMRILAACINCKSAVIKNSKLEKLVQHQQDFVGTLSEGTIEHRIELGELTSMLELQSKLIRNSENA